MGRWRGEGARNAPFCFVAGRWAAGDTWRVKPHDDRLTRRSAAGGMVVAGGG